MGAKAKVLTSKELEMMRVVWHFKTTTVPRAYEKPLNRRRSAYTTVMTTMNILVRKG